MGFVTNNRLKNGKRFVPTLGSRPKLDWNVLGWRA